MDNLSSHKRPAIRQAIRAAKAKLLYLPPYSPDLNPIEQMFSKLKHLLRKASERTAENTWRRIGSLLDAFSPQECANYFANSGYASTSCHPGLMCACGPRVTNSRSAERRVGKAGVRTRRSRWSL